VRVVVDYAHTPDAIATAEGFGQPSRGATTRM